MGIKLLALSVIGISALSFAAKPPVVFVQNAKATTLADTLIYPARISSKIQAVVVTEIDGVIDAISAPLGRAVKRGEKLFSVKNTDPVYNYRPAWVRAPVSGVVSSVEVTEGSRVAKGQKLASLTDPKRISIFIEVASRDLPAINAGLDGELTITGVDTKFPVQVVGVSPQVDPATGTASSELVFMETPKKRAFVPTGSLGRVTFKVRERLGYQVPEYALVYRDTDTFIRTVDENKKAKFQKVKTGPSRRGEVEITEGIKEGMPLILRSSVSVADGEEVSIQNLESGKFE